MSSNLVVLQKAALEYNKSNSQQLIDFCKPLKDLFNIEGFWRGTLMLNSKEECTGYKALTTDNKYMELVFKYPNNGISFTQAIKTTPIGSSSYFLFQNSNECPLKQILCEGLGIVNGLVIYERHENKIESWGFYSNTSRKILNTISDSFLTSLIDFRRYFEEKKILQGSQVPNVEYPAPFDVSYEGPDIHIFEKFRASINLNKIALNSKGDFITLSKREWECLSEVARGKTYKEIARNLSISPRTVEKHFDNVKNKTGVSYRSELVKLFHKNSLGSHF